MAAWDKDLDKPAPAWAKDLDDAQPSKADPQPGPMTVLRGWRDLLAGGVRGAGSIGATLLAPGDAYDDRIAEITGGRPVPSSNDARRQAMTDALTGIGADPESLAFGTGKLGAEIAGTLGVGPALATAASVPRVLALPGAAPVLDAIKTAGFSAAGRAGAAGVGARSLGGGVTGLTSAGLIDPNSAVTGGVVGAALPPVLQGLGKVGGAIGSALRPGNAQRGDRLASILGGDRAQTAAQLRRAQVLVPGSQPTVSQVLRTPEASVAESVVSMSPGGALLKKRALDQSAARMAALDRVAPVNPQGLGSARAEFGESLSALANDTDKTMRRATSAKFQAIPQDEAVLYLPDLGGIRDEIIRPGSIVNRDSVDRVVRAAEDMGLSRAPGLPESFKAQKAVPLSSAVRKAGGINTSLSPEARGELRGIAGNFKNLVRKEGGLSTQRMAEKMHEAGYLPDNTVNSLLNALGDEAGGASVMSVQDEAFRSGSGFGPAVQPKKVTLGQLETLRQDIGELARQAEPKSREKLTLDRMRAALDDRIDEVVRGDGLPDENLPIAWADMLTDARKAKADQVQTTGTGPQSFALRRGQDGMPMYQAQELAQKAWRQNVPPGDVKQLRKLIDKNPKVLAEFRSLVTTEAASTTNAGQALTSKFSRWTKNALPGLRKTFSVEEVKTLQRIAQDIDRAEMAALAGATRNSSTYQNAANALDLGVLDSKAVDYLAMKLPGGGLGLNWLRESSRQKQAKGLAELFADPARAAQALEATGAPETEIGRLLASPEFRRSVLRSAPVASADR